MAERTRPQHVWIRTATATLAAALVLGAAQRAWSQPATSQSASPAPPAVQPLPAGTLTAAQIQVKLDSPVEALNLDNALLTDVLRKVEGGQARWLDLPGTTLSFLPYGEETPVTLRVPAGKKVREVLASLLDPLCLRYRIIEDDRGRGVLRVVPRAELARVGRRATIDELELLFQIRRTQIDKWDNPLEAQLTKAMARTIRLQFDLTGLNPVAAYKKFNESLAGMAPNTVAGLLDQFCLQENGTWRVEENTIRVGDKLKQVLHQLRRHVSVHWKKVPLEDALMQICRSAGVDARFQPGMMDAVEGGSRQIEEWQTPDESILQIIETLSGKTGISYEVHEDSIYFVGPRRADPVVGQVTVGSRSGKYGYQFFLRKSMLSKEAQAAMDQRVQQAVDAMNSELTGTGSANPPVGPVRGPGAP